MVHTYFQINRFFKHETLHLLVSVRASYMERDFDLYNSFTCIHATSWVSLEEQDCYRVGPSYLRKASLANPIIACALLLTWSTGRMSFLKGKSSDSKRKLKMVTNKNIVKWILWSRKLKMVTNKNTCTYLSLSLCCMIGKRQRRPGLAGDRSIWLIHHSISYADGTGRAGVQHDAGRTNGHAWCACGRPPSFEIQLYSCSWV